MLFSTRKQNHNKGVNCEKNIVVIYPEDNVITAGETTSMFIGIAKQLNVDRISLTRWIRESADKNLQTLWAGLQSVT
ncbi:hypothetical protein DOJ94_06540 [Salmonella bongori]|nr:hypothetical protein [Salmonella bongori]